MKLKNLILSVALLAVLSVVAFLANRPAPAPSDDPRVGKALLDPDTASKAAVLVVSDQGKKVELVRDPDGTWRDPAYFDMPADFDKIARFVQDLDEAKVDRFVTASPDRIARLDFKDSSIALKDSGGKQIWSVTLGKAPENGNGRFVRLGDEPKAFLSGLHAWLDTDPKSWADTRLVTIKADEVSKVAIAFEDGSSIEAAREKKDAPWTAKTPAGKILVGEKVNSLLATLTSLRFSDTVDPKDPAAIEAGKYLRRFTITPFGGAALEVSIGRKPEERRLKAPVADAKELLPPAKDASGTPEVKPVTPEMETLPAGPVFVAVASSDAKAPVNALMARRAFKVDDYVFTGLPQKLDDFLEAEKVKEPATRR